MIFELVPSKKQMHDEFYSLTEKLKNNNYSKQACILSLLKNVIRAGNVCLLFIALRLKLRF